MTSKNNLPQDFPNTPMQRSWDIAPLRLLTAISLVFLVTCTVLAGLLMDSDVSVSLVSMRERGVWAGVLMVVALGFFLGVIWYERRVVMNLHLSTDGRHLRLTTPTVFGRRHQVINCSDVTDLQVHGGDSAAEEDWSPPWLRLDVRDSHSYVVPLSGINIERDRLVQFLELCSRRPGPTFEALSKQTAGRSARQPANA